MLNRLPAGKIFWGALLVALAGCSLPAPSIINITKNVDSDARRSPALANLDDAVPLKKGNGLLAFNYHRATDQVRQVSQDSTVEVNTTDPFLTVITTTRNKTTFYESQNDFSGEFSYGLFDYLAVGSHVDLSFGSLGSSTADLPATITGSLGEYSLYLRFHLDFFKYFSISWRPELALSTIYRPYHHLVQHCRFHPGKYLSERHDV